LCIHLRAPVNINIVLVQYAENDGGVEADVDDGVNIDIDDGEEE
jgi:hypothetical protein